MLEMLDYTIRIGSTPTFLYYNYNNYSEFYSKLQVMFWKNYIMFAWKTTYVYGCLELLNMLVLLNNFF